MNESCIQIDDLARVVALPQGDPGRAHLEGCARCQSLAEMLGEFARPDQPAPGAGAERADARVPTPESVRAEAPRVRAASATHERERRPALRPAPAARNLLWFEFTFRRFAVVAVALLVVNAVGLGLWRARSSASIADAIPAPGTVTFASESAHQVPGGITFSWSAIPRATRYQVVFLDESLGVIGRLEPTETTSQHMDTNVLPDGLVRGRTIGWEIEAFVGDRLLAVSPTHTLLVP